MVLTAELPPCSEMLFRALESEVRVIFSIERMEAVPFNGSSYWHNVLGSCIDFSIDDNWGGCFTTATSPLPAPSALFTAADTSSSPCATGLSHELSLVCSR